MTLHRKILLLLIIAVSSGAFMVALHLTSEKQMHHENPFLRQYITGSAEIANKFDLRNRTMYFIGTDGSKIYLGDPQAPLHVFAFDTLLKTKEHFVIALESDQFPFTRVRIRIMAPHFYVFDGSVPVIFKGAIADWKAKLIMSGNDHFFTNAEIMSEDKIAFRAFREDGKGMILGKFTLGDRIYADYAPQLLQRQIEGFFDVDGMLKYDGNAKRLVYTYYYRNQFIVADNKLKIRYRGNTIDTNTVANLKISFDEKTGKRQLAAPATTVNRLSAVSGNLLFINSGVPGRYENEEMWKQARIIDVYNLNSNTYASSFYVYRFDGNLTDMLVAGSNLYVIVGHHLQRYALSKKIVGSNKKQG